MAITLISTVTVGIGGASSIDFNSIPGTYTDLWIVHSGRSTATAVSGGVSVRMRFNGTTTGYSSKALYGQGSGSGASYAPAGWAGSASPSDATASTFSNSTVYIPNYAGSTAKSWSADGVTETNATQAFQEIDASLWTGTSAITSISLTVESANFAQYSTASLYGITKGSSGGVTVS
jgi:hypothetical protein